MTASAKQKLLACFNLIMLFILFIGITGHNFNIAGSTIPFIISAALVINSTRANKNAAK